MARMLASVQNRQEAEVAFQSGADIIDLKDPAKGALGAVDLAKLLEVIDFIDGRCAVSAACGDLPMNPEIIRAVAGNFAGTGADYIKIGFFPSPDLNGCIEALRSLSPHNKLIAVLFADYNDRYGSDLFDQLKANGFHGVMIDTADKSKGRLLDHMAPDQIGNFVKDAQARGLMVGAAGSLEAPDVPRLLAYNPDYLGFRGALCSGRDRTAAIDLRATVKIRGLIPAVQENGPPATVDYKVLAARGYYPDPAIAGLGTDKIFVRAFVLPVQIGAYSFEHGKSQNVSFDVTADVLRVTRNPEDMRHVVSYDLIMDGIRAIVARGHVELVETLAEQIASFILENPRVTHVTVRAEKLELGAGGVGVEIERKNGIRASSVKPGVAPVQIGRKSS